MARIPLTVQEINRLGIIPAFVAANATGGNSVPNDGRTYMEVVLTGTATNITISIPATVDGQAVASRVIAGTGTNRYKIGPFPPTNYTQSSDGTVWVDFSVVTGVTIGAFRLP